MRKDSVDFYSGIVVGVVCFLIVIGVLGLFYRIAEKACQ